MIWWHKDKTVEQNLKNLFICMWVNHKFEETAYDSSIRIGGRDWWVAEFVCKRCANSYPLYGMRDRKKGKVSEKSIEKVRRGTEFYL